MPCVHTQGLAEQLLNVVVKHERADLEEQRESLIQQMSSNKVLLSKLEESLLSNLSSASGNILDNQVGTAACKPVPHDVLHQVGMSSFCGVRPLCCA